MTTTRATTLIKRTDWRYTMTMHRCLLLIITLFTLTTGCQSVSIDIGDTIESNSFTNITTINSTTINTNSPITYNKSSNLSSVENQLIEDLEATNKPISTLRVKEDVAFGESANMLIGLRNTGNALAKYCVKFSQPRQSNGNLNTQIDIAYDTSGITLSPRENIVFGVEIVPNMQPQGLYKSKITVHRVSGENPSCNQVDAQMTTIYAEKSFFINIY